MPTIQQTIAEKFLAKLAESNKVNLAQIERLRQALADAKKPKAEDFAKIFAVSDGGDLR